MKKAFKLWFHIAGVMFLVVFVDFLLFNDFLMSGYYFYMKEIFIAIFVVTIIISVFVIGAYFESFGIVKFKNRFFGYLKLYWSIL
ncbi:hypothetical protein JCM11957_13860 [Caminibacter profundus]